MEHKRINIIISAFLLGLLSACQMTEVTPAPQLPGAEIVAEQSRRTYSIGTHLYYAHRIQWLQSTWLSVSRGLR